MANVNNGTPCCVKGCRNTPHVRLHDGTVLCRLDWMRWWNMGKKAS